MSREIGTNSLSARERVGQRHFAVGQDEFKVKGAFSNFSIPRDPPPSLGWPMMAIHPWRIQAPAVLAITNRSRSVCVCVCVAAAGLLQLPSQADKIHICSKKRRWSPVVERLFRSQNHRRCLDGLKKHGRGRCSCCGTCVSQRNHNN